MSNKIEIQRALRQVVRGSYDLQKLRIQTGNRIVANFRLRLGQDPGKPESEMTAEAKKVLKQIREVYKLMTDGAIKVPKKSQFQPNEVINSYAELALVSAYERLTTDEKQNFSLLSDLITEFPVWEHFLEDVRGVGPTMAGVIISEIDITRAQYPSSIYRLAGLDVGPDGRGRGRYKEHLVKYKYTNRDGEEAERMGLTFSPFLKTKLMGVLAPSFIKLGGHYRTVYDDYKHRISHMAEHQEKRPAHRNDMAKRYMIKMFLRDLYYAWRPLEGCTVYEDFRIAKLRGEPHSGPHWDTSGYVEAQRVASKVREQLEAKRAEKDKAWREAAMLGAKDQFKEAS